MMVLFALLLSFAGIVSASEPPHEKTIAAWTACENAAVKSDEAHRIEDIAGRTGVADLVHRRCGFRPLAVRPDGRLALDYEACVTLLRWHTEGVCAVEDTVALDLFARALDPRVFDRRKYRARCEDHLEIGRADDYRSFRAEICEGARDARH